MKWAQVKQQSQSVQLPIYTYMHSADRDRMTPLQYEIISAYNKALPFCQASIMFGFTFTFTFDTKRHTELTIGQK